jgi:hypothetical protein
MMKRPFIIFCLVVAILVASTLSFIQSTRFAGVLKSFVAHYIPKDLGISGDFSEISIQLYPPGFSLKNPRLWVQERNPVHLPGGSLVEAKRIDFTFLPLQIFSGDIRVHQVTVSEGEVRLTIDLPQQAAGKSPSVKSPVDPHHRFHWEDLFRFRTDGIVFENVQVRLGAEGEEAGLQGLVRSIQLFRSESRSLKGYELDLDLNQFRGKWLSLISMPESVESLRAKARINAAGVEIKELMFRLPGLMVQAPGHLRGDVLNLQKSLEADLSIKANGDLGSVVRPFQGASRAPLPSGRFELDGKLVGNLLKPLETIKIGASVQLEEFALAAWRAQLLKAKLRWEASPQGGVLMVDSGMASSPALPRSREGGDQPGDGGRIEFGPLQWELGSLRPLSLPLKFEHAHIHWLAAPGIESLFPLDFRLNGATQLTVKPREAGKSWEIQADFKNWLEDFQLDNQQYRKITPVHTVFQIPKIFLSGRALIDSTGIRPNQVDISLPHSVLHATGKIDFKKGYDLNAVGSLDLADLGTISGNAIYGKGPAQIRVHGASVGVLVDVDLDIKEGRYLNLNLGSVLGRVTWDDHNNRLIFSKTQLKHGETQYSVNGAIDVGNNDRVNLDVQVSRGDIQDFIQIFSRLTENLSWFPSSLNGPFEGSLKVMGGLSFPKLVVSSEIEGRDWEFYGEKFRKIHLVGGYDRGTYQIENLAAIKATGAIQAKLSFDESSRIQWKVDAKNLAITDFDHLAQSDIPLRGDLSISSEGRGRIDQVESASELDLSRFSIRGVQMPPSHSALITHAGVARWIGSFFDGQADVNMVYDVNPNSMSLVQVALSQFDFSPLLLLFNKKSMQDVQLASLFSGELNLKFRVGELNKARGFFQVSDFFASNSDTRFQLDHPIRVDVTDGNFEINQLAIAGKTKKAILDLANRDNVLSGRILGELDNSWVYFLLPSVTQIRGASQLNFSIGGSIAQPSIEGELGLSGGEVRVEALESPFENLTGKIRVKQNVVTVQNVRSDLGGGRVTVNGEVRLSAEQSPAVDVKVNIQDSKIKVYPFQYAKLSGQIGVHGPVVPYLIDGGLIIDTALFREKMLNQGRGGEGFKAIQYLPVPTAQGKAPISMFHLNIGLEAPRGVLVQNDLFRDVVAKGKLTLVNTLETPRVLGRLEIAQGNLIFKGHAFQIQSASALFDSPTVINPSFDLVANTEANNVKIQMYASGRKSDMKIELTSNPSMPESEIFSLLALGLTSNDAKKYSTSDLGLIRQGEAASLVLHSLDFNRELEDRTGLQVLVDESVYSQQGVSAFRTQNESYVAPQITIKKKFGDRISVSAGSTVGVGSSKSNQINVGYSVNSDLSVNLDYNNYGSNNLVGNNGAYGATDTQSFSSQSSLGLGFKFMKRFK